MNKEKNISNTNFNYFKRKNMVSSFILSDKYTPMSESELRGIFNISKDERHILNNILKDLLSEKVISYINNTYIPNIYNTTFKCIFECKNSKYGFAIPIESKEDFYIPNENMNNAMDKDEVLVVFDPRYSTGNRKVGKIVKIVKRKQRRVVGNLIIKKKYSYVEPIESNLPIIYVDNADSDIKDKDLVVVLITEYNINRLKGEILKRISAQDKNKAYVEALFYSFDLDNKINFNNGVLKEVENIPTEVSKQDYTARVDKTKENIYTIDSFDAKNLDDAISIKKVNNDYVLSVHIADVSHYVKEDTKLNDEAIKRGTSIYIPGTVIPMLPKELSNGICSLSENQVRLALSVDMKIDKKGNVLDYNIYKSVICSKKKMTYENVYKCIEKSDLNVLREYKDYLEDIYLMKDLAEILRNKRMKEGSINFNIPETKVILDENKNLCDITKYDTNIANNIIEEFMLITNVVIATKFNSIKAPFIYRVHEKPSEEKLHDLNDVLSNYNKKLPTISNVTPKMISNVLSTFNDEQEETILSTLILRTLKLAKYSEECLGHFGLSFKNYCHFTSPIRRYPDLFIHRVISDYIDNGYNAPSKKLARYKKESIMYAETSSNTEKEATKIERDFDDLYMCIYMKDKIGQEFEGVISGVTSFGLFIKLENTIQGLVHISMLEGYYEFDEKKYMLIGDRNIYKIAQKVKVRLVNVDIKLKQIDFEIV